MVGFIWVGKKVFILTHSKRVYQGKVIDETPTTLIMIDKFNHQVEISKIDIKTCEEQEFIRGGYNGS